MLLTIVIQVDDPKKPYVLNLDAVDYYFPSTTQGREKEYTIFKLRSGELLPCYESTNQVEGLIQEAKRKHYLLLNDGPI